MKLNGKEVLRPTLVLFLICLLTTLALAGTNLLTKNRIAQQEILAEEESRQVVLPQAEVFEETDGYVIGKTDSGETAGYIFVTEAKGYGGTIKVMTGISSNGTVTGVKILSHGETVGLGANVEKDSFLSQYNQALPQSGFSVIKGATAGDGQISAVTGATISSNAVTKAVNEALTQYSAISGGE